MTEEEKLDEKTLQDVTDGASIADEWTYEEWTFICNNCISCRHEGSGNCPYGTDKHTAFRKEGAACRRKEVVQ